jgi:hypothetical protein
VEDKMLGVPAKPLGKYKVSINGEDYPPKQVIALSLGKDLVAFTTMDASRILTALGFDVQRVGEKQQPRKNDSELLFEQYLAMSKLSQFDFEKEFPGKTQRPDYYVELSDQREVLFEVKEFRVTMDDFRPGGGGAYDPYQPIREKINQASQKFKEFKDYCCCLVLFNREKPLVDLGWQFVYGAMLGNVGFKIPVNFETGVADEEKVEQTFMTGGKMLRYKGLQPVGVQNQTISAILVLDLLQVGRRRFDAFVERLELERKGKLDVEEYTALIESCRGTERDITLMQLRGIAHENPHARFPLPDDVFAGPYDERYGARGGRIQQLYEGAGLRSLPGDIDESGLHWPPRNSLGA